MYILTRVLPPTLCCFISLTGIFATCQAQPNENPVKWVNPQLPDAPGLQHFVLDCKAIGHQVGYVVWTPPDFDIGGANTYPVIYFLHGMGGNESADAGGFSGFVAKGIKAGWLPPAIVVFPNGGRSGYRGDVEKMITTELVPRIDETYPTKAEPSSRILAGFSMGGQGAVRLAILHPDLFSAAGSWGGGLRQGADEVYEAAEKSKQTLIDNGFSALLVNGDQDRPDAYEKLTGILKPWGLNIETVVLPETKHNLGRYYALSGDRMVQFIGQQLRGK